MKVHLVCVIGCETIKDMDSDYLHPETAVVEFVCATGKVAKEIEKFAMGVYKKLHDLLKADKTSEDDLQEGFDTEEAQDALVDQFTKKYPEKKVRGVSNHELAKQIVEGSVNGWADQPSKLLNIIRVAIYEKELIS